MEARSHRSILVAFLGLTITLATASQGFAEALVRWETESGEMLPLDRTTVAETSVEDGKSVSYRLYEEAAARIRKMTSDNVGKRLILIFRERVISKPIVREPITGTSALISLGPDHGELATEIAEAMRR